jgi:hydrogenase-4 component B
MLNSGSGILLLASFAVQIIAIGVMWLQRNERKSFFAANIILGIGLFVGFVSTLSSTLFFTLPVPAEQLCFNNWIRLDGLGLFFLFIIQLVAIPAVIYNFSYLQHYLDEKRSIRAFFTFFTIMLVSTELLVLSNHVLLFLISWEVMSITAYVGMTLEKEKEEVQNGSFYYFAMSHVLIFILYIFFFLLHHLTGSWILSDYHLSFSSGPLIPLLFILSLLGFGMKAGFMPFHFWLPRAHPVAPSVLSAFLSAVIIKTGIYGILRTFQFLKPVPEWCGWLMLGVSLISAILGVWYALAQHDIKRLLAYHSVENIGIIGIGIGIGFLGSANHLPAVEVLGFGGALLHTLNHAIFKSLLFIGSGVVSQKLGTRNIELMGGLIHRAKYITLFFLIGSVAISGIPPFNGFISEFIIYTGFFRTATELKNYYPILMLMFVVGLAFVGGLAVACFTKVNSIMFLGVERKPVAHFKTTVYEHCSLGILAFLCIAIGLYPQPFVGVVNKVIGNCLCTGSLSTALITIDWFYFTMIFSSLAIAVLILYAMKLRIERKFGRRTSAAWGCGYENLTPRMMYTASSFADELNSIPKSVLLYQKEVDISDNAFPLASKFESHSSDFVDNKIMLPLFASLKRFITKFDFLSQTDIRYYIAFIVISIAIYSVIAFLCM